MLEKSCIIIKKSIRGVICRIGRGIFKKYYKGLIARKIKEILAIDDRKRVMGKVSIGEAEGTKGFLEQYLMEFDFITDKLIFNSFELNTYVGLIPFFSRYCIEGHKITFINTRAVYHESQDGFREEYYDQKHVIGAFGGTAYVIYKNGGIEQFQDW